MRGLLLLLLTGCNAVFGIHDIQAQDATVYPDAVGCSGVRFQAPSMLDVGLTFHPGDGELDDPSAFWFAMYDPNRHIYVAPRMPDGSFGQPVVAPTIATTVVGKEDYDPALTADGLDLFFVSTRTDAAQVYEATRTSTSDPFGPPLTVEIGSFDPANGIDVSFDGRTLYVTDNSGPTTDLHELYRPQRDRPFGTPSGVIATRVTWPSVSPDGKELFYVAEQAAGVRRSVRADPTLGTPFDMSAYDVVAPSGDDPDITGDATRLVVLDSNVFQVYSRTCP